MLNDVYEEQETTFQPCSTVPSATSIRACFYNLINGCIPNKLKHVRIVTQTHSHNNIRSVCLSLFKTLQSRLNAPTKLEISYK